MSYNGSGTFLINTSGQPVVTGTPISSTVFNALTADLATGLSTAITKDGQTATTARIPFAAGINSTLVTDSTSTTTGSIITAGGAGVAKALFVGTTANVAGAVTLQSTLGVTGITTFSAQPIFSSLTASSAVATDASKGLVSVTNTGTGNNVLATSPTLVTPVLGAASATSVTVAAGAVGTPSITTAGDTNTGIFFPAADTIAFAEGGVESVRIDSSGNVGIGTSSPTGRLNVDGGAGNSKLKLSNTASGNTGSDGFDLDFTGTDIYITNRESGFMAFENNGAERMRITSTGDVGIGTSSPSSKLHVVSSSGENKIISEATAASQQASLSLIVQAATPGQTVIYMGKTGATTNGQLGYDPNTNAMTMYTNNAERMRIDSSGNLLVGKTSTSFSDVGVLLSKTSNEFTVSGAKVMAINRRADDGTLIEFFQETTGEGSISVSGTTVSYNGGHLSRWAQTTAPKDNTLLKGTVLSNLDEMNVYTDADGNPVDNEQLNKVKVSDVEGDANVAGVFVNWTHDDQHDVDEINMAMTGDMIIRIAQGTTVARGDLLMSAGDGTAKPQGDDIVRSKTVAKVTSTHVTCTYADGSYCVPCVLMAC